jgi:hypothetical protein
MKKLLFVLISLFVINGFLYCQQKNKQDSVAAKKISNNSKDTVYLPADSVEFIAIQDLNIVMATLGDRVSHNNYEMIKESFNMILKEALIRRNKKKTSK